MKASLGFAQFFISAVEFLTTVVRVYAVVTKIYEVRVNIRIFTNVI